MRYVFFIVMVKSKIIIKKKKLLRLIRVRKGVRDQFKGSYFSAACPLVREIHVHYVVFLDVTLNRSSHVCLHITLYTLKIPYEYEYEYDIRAFEVHLMDLFVYP